MEEQDRMSARHPAARPTFDPDVSGQNETSWMQQRAWETPLRDARPGEPAGREEAAEEAPRGAGVFRGQRVLTEEEWVASMEAIIERDYFPELPKLKNKLEWLQAVGSRDPAAILAAQTNILKRRAGMATPAIDAGPGRLVGDATPALGHGEAGEGCAGPGDAVPAAPAMTLDQFVHSHTSEDNAAFHAIIDKEDARRRVKNAWAWNPRGLPAPPARVTAALPRPDTAGQPRLLEGPKAPAPADPSGEPPREVRLAVQNETTLLTPDQAKQLAEVPSGDRAGFNRLLDYTVRSRLYYDTSQQVALPLTEKDWEARVRGPPRETHPENTRLAPLDAPGTSSATTPGIGTPSTTAGAPTPRGGPGGGGVGAGLGPAAGPGALPTPTIVPGGGGEEPIMTWGAVVGTPLVVRESDMDVDVGRPGAGEYKMPRKLMKDVVGEVLANATAHKRQGKGLGRGAAGMIPRSLAGSPAGGVRKTPALSGAAHRLASSLRRGTPAVDAALRATYRGGATPTPARRGAGAAQTPTVAPGRGAGGATSKDVTDGLLNL